MAPDVTASE